MNRASIGVFALWLRKSRSSMLFAIFQGYPAIPIVYAEVPIFIFFSKAVTWHINIPWENSEWKSFCFLDIVVNGRPAELCQIMLFFGRDPVMNFNQLVRSIVKGDAKKSRRL